MKDDVRDYEEIFKFNRNILYCKYTTLSFYIKDLKDLIETFCIVNHQPIM